MKEGDRAPLVSICIPSFNYGSVISRAIASALEQTFSDLEVVVSDDGSSDDSVGVLSRLAGEDGRVRVVPNRGTRGIYRNLANAVRASNGRFVKFLMADDWLSPDYLERTLLLLEDPSIGLVTVRQAKVGLHGEWLGVRDNPVPGRSHLSGQEYLLTVTRRINGIGNPSRVILPRVVYEEFGGFDENNHFAAEMGLWLKIVTRYDIGCVDETLCFETLHPGQQSHCFMADDSGFGYVLQALDGSFASASDFWTLGRRGALCRYGLGHFVRAAFESALSGDLSYWRSVRKGLAKISPPQPLVVVPYLACSVDPFPEDVGAVAASAASDGITGGMNGKAAMIGLLKRLTRDWPRPPRNLGDLWFQVHGNPVLVTSIPKAGTHLVKEVLVALNFRKVNGTVEYYGWPEQDPNQTPLGDVRRLLGKLHRRCYALGHVVWQKELAEAVSNRGIRVVLMVRDPRDIMVSHVFHCLRREGSKFHEYYQRLPDHAARLRVTIEGFERDDPVLPMYWLPSVEQRLPDFLRWRELPNCVTCRFEDLVGSKGGGSDTRQRSAIGQIVRSFGLSLDEGRIKQLASHLFSTSSATFRRGAIGSWREHFEAEHKELFKARAQGLLEDLGYEKDENW